MNKLLLHFALGMRVVDEPKHPMPPDAFLDKLYAALSPEEAYGRDLYLFDTPSDTLDPEPVYIVAIANMSLKESRRVYQRILHNMPLISCLSVYRPFVQNNYLAKCRNERLIGHVDTDGTVKGGEISVGSMRFCAPPLREALVIRHRFLLAPCAYEGLTPAQATRCLTRAVASRFPDANIESFPLASDGTGMLDAFIYHRGGRYVRCKVHDTKGREIAADYGILSDYSAVIESAAIRRNTKESDEADERFCGSYGVGELLLHALTAKCRRIYLCIDGRALSDQGDGFMRVLGMQNAEDGERLVVDAEQVHPRLKETEIVILSDTQQKSAGLARKLSPFACVTEASAVETLMQQGSFDCRLREMTLVFSGIGCAPEETGLEKNVMARIGAHCKKGFKQLVEIRLPDEYEPDEAERVFEAAAVDAIMQMKFENWFIALTSEIVPVSGEKRRKWGELP